MESNIFIDNEHFNCPICHGMGCHYKVWGIIKFFTSNTKYKYVLFVECIQPTAMLGGGMTANLRKKQNSKF